VNVRVDEGSREGTQTLWGWIAVGILVVCWIAEAALCAARGS
jgi:hypothetical protein